MVYRSIIGSGLDLLGSRFPFQRCFIYQKVRMSDIKGTGI